MLVVANATACSDGCASQSVRRAAAPDRRHQALMFRRDCGATTGFSTQISILAEREALSGSGNFYRADDDHGATAAGSWAHHGPIFGPLAAAMHRGDGAQNSRTPPTKSFGHNRQSSASGHRDARADDGGQRDQGEEYGDDRLHGGSRALRDQELGPDNARCDERLRKRERAVGAADRAPWPRAHRRPNSFSMSRWCNLTQVGRP